MENEYDVDRREGNLPAQEQQIEIKIMRSPVSILPEDGLSPAVSPTNQEASLISSDLPADVSSSLDNRQQASENENVRTSITDATTPEEQPALSEIPNLSESTLENKEESLSSAPPVISPQDRQTPTETQPFIPPATDSELPLEGPDSSTTPAVSEDQQSVIDEQALSSVPPSIDLEVPSESSSALTITENRESSSDVQLTTDISSDEQQILLQSSSISPDVQEKTLAPAQTEPSAINDDNVQEQPFVCIYK